MTTKEVADKLVGLCRNGEFPAAIKELYSPDIVSVEAAPMPDGSREMKGLDAVLGKTEWWLANHEVHGGQTDGPLVSGTHFCVRFHFDVTPKATGKRTAIDELAVYHVVDGKIVREEFFYSMG
jgi:ketosteroid isomerase-like protein